MTKTVSDPADLSFPFNVNPDASNSLSRYYGGLQLAMRELSTAVRSANSSFFEPGWVLPERTPLLDKYWSVASIADGAMGEYQGRALHLLDLTGNPRVRTTKTFGTSVIVARAIAHSAATGQPILLLTPSAANKAVALREAVLRAYETGIASPRTLRAAVLVPRSSLQKVWASPLDAKREWAGANPIGVFAGEEREAIKGLATSAAGAAADRIESETGFKLWYTLDPRNYMAADVVRAFHEAEFLPQDDRPHLHVHTVSSAYGFLGHDLGRRILGDSTRQIPGYLFVQHLETPDIVTGVPFSGNSFYEVPRYLNNSTDGLWHSTAMDAHFPARTTSPTERVERTFYTRTPPTLPLVRDLASRRAADGIVVSLVECLERYSEIRSRLASAGMSPLPSDPRDLREFATVMAMVGAYRAIESDLVPADARLVIHASGAYSAEEVGIAEQSAMTEITTSRDVEQLLLRAASATHYER